MAQDTNFHLFLAFGQSNMEGFPGLEEQDKGPVDSRFQVLAAVDFPELGRKKGQWYPATPPLARPRTGIGPSDYFGRTLLSLLPAQAKVGVVNVSVAGCKIELFQKDHEAEYAATAPEWMKATIRAYGGSPYQCLVDLARLAQKDGVIKGILLHQGESNTGDKDWPRKVKAIYESLLKDLNLRAEAVPLLAGELVGADQGGACASMNAIIQALPQTIPTAHVISSAGCLARPDHLHFTPAGYRELGKRYAEKMRPLLLPQKSPASRKATSIAVPQPRTDENSKLAHQQLVAKAKTGKIDLYFLGDSITRRWGCTDLQWAPLLANWKQNFFGWNAANFGWGADGIQNMLWRIQNGELDGVNPKVIVLLAGTNNIGSTPAPTEQAATQKVDGIVEGVRALIKTCQEKAPRAVIVLTAIFPRNDNKAVLPEILRVNQGLERLADNDRVVFLSVNDKLADPDGNLRDGMTIDKLHLSVRGYEVWAEGLRPLLTRYLGKPAATDHAPPPTGDPSAVRSPKT